MHEDRIRQIMSGQARGVGASAMRAALQLCEPFYASATRLRNVLFDTGIKRQHRLNRPVISIGNITTGGTGKTPAVQWIARQLIARRHHPAVLLRGYKAGASAGSDEAILLERSLNIPVRAHPNRVASGRNLLATQHHVDVILLDDGFQHRRLHRDLNIVLIDATNPFGYDHVLPRGMLREPLVGFGRADVLILTRSDLASAHRLSEIESRIRQHNRIAPILRAQHRILAIVHGAESIPLESLKGRRVFSFCGIANPAAFHQHLSTAGAIDAGHRWFADHADYSRDQIDAIVTQAKQSNAEMIVTTEKDWVKIEPLITASGERGIWRAQMEMTFNESDAAELISRIAAIIPPPASSSPAGSEQPASAE